MGIRPRALCPVVARLKSTATAARPKPAAVLGCIAGSVGYTLGQQRDIGESSRVQRREERLRAIRHSAFDSERLRRTRSSLRWTLSAL